MEGRKVAEETYVHQAYTEFNPLTGLYYNRAFLKKADEFLEEIVPGTYSLVAIDIINFRLFNRLYGREEGDRFLVHVANCLKKRQDMYHGIAGYLGGDNFCIIMPDREGIVESLEEEILQALQEYDNTVGFYPVFGIYPIVDNTEAAVLMYDRATIAIANSAGKYSERICKYSSGMEEKFEEELKLLSDIQRGLEEEEFTFYAQPQCDISTGKIVGAESLVRWNHSTKGLVSPGVFIPALEKNGMIGMLDRYVWKKVCEWLRSWLDKGFHPVPVSINVSRLDISSMNVPAYLNELLQTYDLPAKLLKVEITESAYAENSAEIIQTVKELRDTGFMVMMDDFGSGYSSLNMLKDVSVDVLKLDMRFLDIGEQQEEKGIGILESVVNMARMMGLPIIVEGVENQKQEKFLIQMGCRYIQGFYYYRPLPLAQFEELLSDERRLDFGGLLCKQVESMHVREFLDDNLFDDKMVNNMLGAIAFYEIYDNQIEITRVNEQYYQLTGFSAGKADSDTKVWSHVRDDDKMLLLSIFEQAYENEEGGAHGNIHYLRADGKVLWVHISIFFLREKDGHKSYYGSLVDITSTRKKKKKAVLSEQEITEVTEKQYHRMEKYYGNMPFGYGVAKVLLNEVGEAENYEITYLNHEMAKICGNSIERFRTLMGDTFDGEELLEIMYRVACKGKQEEKYIYSSISNRYLQLNFYQYEYGYVGCTMYDITKKQIYEDALNSILMLYQEVYFVNLQENYLRMIYPDESNMLERGNYEEGLNRHIGMGKIAKEDEQRTREFLSLENLKNELMKKDTVDFRYKRILNDKEEWCVTSITVSEREQGMPKTAIVTIRNIEAMLLEEEERKRKSMTEMLVNMSDGFFVYRATGNEKILYANPKVVQIYGCDSLEEFLEMVQHSFQGMVHKEDINRVEWEINEQIQQSESNMDYIKYRIIRKDGEIRWIDDCGHMEYSGSGADGQLFYVFISDITDTISESEKRRLLTKSQYY